MTTTLPTPLVPTSRSLTTRRPDPRTLLTAGTAAAVAVAAVSLVGLAVADDTITGAPAWLKPLKFGVSVTAYLLTLRWVVGHVTGHRRLLTWLAGGIAVGLTGELVGIVGQVVRGTSSHFNETTTFDGAVFQAMGALIGVVFLLTLVLARLVVRQGGLDAGLAAGMRWGLGVSLLGMLEAGLMIANRTWSPSGGHTVGAVDGGPGLPLTGWSTAHGDLRVAHFVGLHALQLLPLLAYALQRRTVLVATVRARLVAVAGLTQAGLVGLLAWQAERGQPLLRPDLRTAAAAAALLGVAALGAYVVLRRARQVPSRARTVWR